MSHYYERLKRRMLEYESLGSRKLRTGVHLIGNVPHIAPKAYFHVTYPRLTTSQIEGLEKALGRYLPTELKDFYKNTNGIKLFAYSLNIYGRRTSYVRTGDEAWQPFCILLYNGTERPPDTAEDLVYFGSYEWDGSQLAMSANRRTVYRCAADSATVLNEWPSFEVMLTSEFDRLAQMFDKKGRKLDEDAATTPNE